MFYRDPFANSYPDHNNIIKSLNNKIEKLLKYDVKDFSSFCTTHIGENQGIDGEFQYYEWENEEATYHISEILEYVKEFNQVNFSYYPIAFVKNLNQYLTTSDKLFAEIEGKESSKETLKKLADLFELMQEKGGRYLIWNDLLNKQQELEKIIADFWNIKNPAMQVLETSWNENIKKANELKASAATAHHANNFNEQSKYHKEYSKYWLFTSVIIAIIVFGMGLYFLLNPPITTTTDNLFIYATSKIVLFAVLFYILSICTKNYKAHQHNMLINSHRYNALCTYDYFISASNDNEAKKSMLSSVFNTIFINQSTSFESDYSSAKEIIEPLKDVLSKKG